MDNTKQIQFNIWDKMMIFYLILLVFGAIGGALTPIRIFTFCMIPIMLYKQNTIAVLKHHKYERVFLISWVVYAFLMIFMAIDILESFKYWLHLTLNIYAFFVLLWMASKASNPQKAIVTGWVIMFLCTIPIAIWEFYTDQHLPWSYLGSDFQMNFGSGVSMQRRFAAIAFGNLNGYNFILCYTLSFIAFKIISKDTLITKFQVCNWLLLAILCMIVIFNSSRASILCLVLGLMCLFLYFARNSWKMLTLLVILVGIVIYIAIKNELFLLIFTRFSSQGFEDTGRMENIVYGIRALLDTNLIGVGTNNYSYVMERFGLEITAPHNIFIEVATQFGIVIFLGYVYMLFRIVRAGVQNPQKANRVFVFTTIVLYPLVHIINSGYLLHTEFWIYLSSIYIIADSMYNGTTMELQQK